MVASADEIRTQISTTRYSLDRRLDRLARKLRGMDPRVRLGPERVKRVGAMAAVATGVVMLIRNVRTLRHRRALKGRRHLPIPVL
jgi:hypothetical protein